MKLTPCPYCGTEPEALHIFDGEEIVRCPNEDGCPVHPHAAMNTLEDAKYLWNERMAALDRIEKLEAMMKWQPIETAPVKTRVLLRYFKGNKPVYSPDNTGWVVTEATFTPRFFFEWDTVKNYPQGNEWHDALGRLICKVDAKTIKNFPTHWMPVPPPPPKAISKQEMDDTIKKVFKTHDGLFRSLAEYERLHPEKP